MRGCFGIRILEAWKSWPTLSWRGGLHAISEVAARGLKSGIGIPDIVYSDAFDMLQSFLLWLVHRNVAHQTLHQYLLFPGLSGTSQ